MTTKGHCESSLGSFDECSAAHKRLSTLRPSHLTWAVSSPVGSYRLQPSSPFIIITQPESCLATFWMDNIWMDNWFTIPRRVEGWVNLGTAGKVHTARAQGCKSQWLCDKHNCPQRDSIPGPHALQSDMLPLDHCDLPCPLIQFGGFVSNSMCMQRWHKNCHFRTPWLSEFGVACNWIQIFSSHDKVTDCAEFCTCSVHQTVWPWIRNRRNICLYIW